MELMDYMFLPDEEVWRGYPKAHPDYQAFGKSFEELRLNLHHLHLDLTRSTSSSTPVPLRQCVVAIGSGGSSSSTPLMRREGNGRC